MKIKQKDLYIGELLNTSYFNGVYKICQIAALTYFNNNNEGLIINGLVKYKED